MSKPIDALLLLVCGSLLLVSSACSGGGRTGRRDDAAGSRMNRAERQMETDMSGKVVKTDDEWRALLTPEQYRITRQKGTEPAFSGKYHKFKGDGVYRCVACGNELFDSEQKYDSGTGWPSFRAPVAKEKVGTETDTSYGKVRTEVHCSRCGAHLGHVFEDGPRPTGLRYCINSAALEFEAGEGKEKKE